MHDPHLHLLVDDAEVLGRRGLTRLVERPQRVTPDPVLRPERSWEGNAVAVWGSIYRVDGRYRMWYMGANVPEVPSASLCYAESGDGMHWDRPALELVPQAGPGNNLALIDEREPRLRRLYPATVLYDPDANPQRRFAFISFCHDVAGVRGYVIAFSADGIDWQLHPERVALPRGDRTAVMQDFIRGGYLMTSRSDRALSIDRRELAVRRDIAISRSGDLLSWTPTSRVFDADDGDDPACEFYGMPLFNWGNQYLGMLERYDPTNEILDVQLASSRDGERWERACARETYLSTGPSDAWDSTWVAMSMSPPVVDGDRMLMWYTGRPNAHRRLKGAPLRSAIGLLRAPRDRFAGLRAGPDGGVLTTTEVTVGAPRLLLNVGAAAGPVSVAVLGETAPIPGFGHDDWDRRVESGVDVPVSWGGRDLAPLVGRRVRLNFRVTYATLFAYRFAAAEGAIGP